MPQFEHRWTKVVDRQTPAQAKYHEPLCKPLRCMPRVNKRTTLLKVSTLCIFSLGLKWGPRFNQPSPPGYRLDLEWYVFVGPLWTSSESLYSHCPTWCQTLSSYGSPSLYTCKHAFHIKCTFVSPLLLGSAGYDVRYFWSIVMMTIWECGALMTLWMTATICQVVISTVHSVWWSRRLQGPI